MASGFSTNWLLVSEPSSHVYHVELARKPVNAFSMEFWTDYGRLFDNLTHSGADVRVVVLSSSLPKIFTAGIDLSSLNNSLSAAEDDGARRAFSLTSIIREFQHHIGAPLRCPFPVIVAVHGPVIGLGVDIISACDIRYAASNATFSIKETEIGLAADIGTLSYLPKVTGHLSLVREYAYTSQFFDATVAQRMGLISTIVAGGRVEVVQATLNLAKAIASKSPVAVAGTKRLISHAIDHSIAQSLDYTAIWNSAALQTNDLAEIRTAMMEKREPRFEALKKPGPKL
ncbi:Delta2-dienoyl-CoA-isomerase [Hymenopellis radicata]|nr:Delta2-dienoyl-CoA-isomerase [Hymenopellis radicata]